MSYVYFINLRSQGIHVARPYLVADMDVELVEVHPKVDFVLQALSIYSGRITEHSHLPRPRPPCFSAKTAKQRFNFDKQLYAHEQLYLGRASTRLFPRLPLLN